MSKRLALLASPLLANLKAVLIIATLAFATGDGLPVILISLLFNVVQLGDKTGPPGHRRSLTER
jgi:hypothetical protein